ncbi:hypothetical protein E2C01_030586 [Portunus trituberculatus]|uniref:Uncharacterized protein n=1 Tax=Portunus trituberculatus TaxID=210409 RepID=A0A5B7ESE5_PORTR|nr:hypothetical protein [Portunus trituberculatus]
MGELPVQSYAAWPPSCLLMAGQRSRMNGRGSPGVFASPKDSKRNANKLFPRRTHNGPPSGA